MVVVVVGVAVVVAVGVAVVVAVGVGVGVGVAVAVGVAVGVVVAVAVGVGVAVVVVVVVVVGVGVAVVMSDKTDQARELLRLGVKWVPCMVDTLGTRVIGIQSNGWFEAIGDSDCEYYVVEKMTYPPDLDDRATVLLIAEQVREWWLAKDGIETFNIAYRASGLVFLDVQNESRETVYYSLLVPIVDALLAAARAAKGSG